MKYLDILYKFYQDIISYYYLEPKAASQTTTTPVLEKPTATPELSKSNPESSAESQQSTVEKNYAKPAQDKLTSEIVNLESKISKLSGLKESGLATVENISHLKDSWDELKKAQQKLKSLIADAKNHRKRHAEKKQVITELASQSITNASKLRKFMHSSTG